MVITSANTGLEYFDGFDDYTTAEALYYWTGFGGAVTAGAGRNGTGAATWTGSGTGLWLTLAPRATRTAGFALKLGGAMPGIGEYLVAFADGLTFSGGGLTSGQVGARVRSDGTIQVDSGGAPFGVSTQALGLSAWHYLELSATIHPTAGSFTLRVDGTTWLAGSGLNTRVTANNSADTVFFGRATAGTIAIDDLYVRSDATFQGNVRVESVLPSGAGASAAWARGGTDSGANWSQVDQVPAGGDSSYVVAATAGPVDLYTFPALPTPSGIAYAVMTLPLARNDAGGSSALVSQYRPSGTVFDGGSQPISYIGYAPYPDIQGLNPATAAAWTIGQVNACQFGIKRTA